MNTNKCDLNYDCNDSQICLLNEQNCVDPNDNLIGFEINKKVYYAKSVEEIEDVVQQLVVINKLDLGALKCTVGMNFESEDSEFDTFVGENVRELRKKLSESKENPINLISIINASDGSVYCENFTLLKRYFRQKLYDKNYKGFVHRKGLNEDEIQLLKEEVLENPDRSDLFSNFPLVSGIFIICNHELVNSLNTIVYYLVKLTDIKWRDINFGESVYHNDYRNGDDVHILIPVGDRRFFCNEFKGECQSVFWNTEQEKPLAWDKAVETRDECEKSQCERDDELQDKFSEYVENNNLDGLIEIYSRGGVDINYKNDNRSTYLHIASDNGNLDIVKFLISKGCNMYEVDNNGITALDTAVIYNNLNIVEFFISLGIPVEDSEEHSESALHMACAQGNLEMIKLLLKNGADINKLDENLNTVLHHAATNPDNCEVIQFLIDRGVDVDAQNNKNVTPLFGAMFYKSLENVKCLLENGANINNEDLDGNKVVHIAVLSGSVDILKILIKNNVDISLKNNRGFSPLYYAIKKRNIKMVKHLIKNGASTNNIDNRGTSAVQLANSVRDERIIKLLSE